MGDNYWMLHTLGLSMIAGVVDRCGSSNLDYLRLNFWDDNWLVVKGEGSDFSSVSMGSCVEYWECCSFLNFSGCNEGWSVMVWESWEWQKSWSFNFLTLSRLDQG